MAGEILRYSNSNLGFSVDYLADWSVMEGLPGLVVGFAGPEVLDGTYTISINVAVERLREDIALKDYIKASELKAQRNIPGYNKVQEYDTTICGLPAIVWVQTSTTESYGGHIALRDKKAMFVKDNIVYVITYDVPAEFHNQYAGWFDLAINSFRFE